MDGTTDQTTTPITPAAPAPIQAATPPAPTPPAPAPAPTPPSTPPLQVGPKSPFPLKWALVGIGIIVVLAGSILGILGANSKQTAYTTDTKAAGNRILPTRTPPSWPFATLPNAMLEKGTIDFEIERDNNGKETGFITLHGNVIFAKTSFSGSESWVVWASKDDRGKEKVGTTYPKGNAQLGEPKEPFPNPGTFTTGSSYPADSDREPDAPKPEENEGKLINSTRTDPKTGEEIDIQPHTFHIHQIPKNTCELYLNYRSNRQGGNSVGNNSPMFYKVTLPACRPTATPEKATPTMPKGRLPSKTPTPTQIKVVEGCGLLCTRENADCDNVDLTGKKLICARVRGTSSTAIELRCRNRTYPESVDCKPPVVSPTPELSNVRPGCTVIARYEGTSGQDNWGTCDELCGLKVGTTSTMCSPNISNEKSCMKQSCRPGVNNPYIPSKDGYSRSGNWYCCNKANCGASCNTTANCSAGLECVGSPGAKVCMDTNNCSQNGSCQCTTYKAVRP